MQVVGNAVHPGRVLDDPVKQVGQRQEVASRLSVGADGSCLRAAQPAAQHHAHHAHPHSTN